MTKRRVSNEVFYDQNNGEFQVLSSELLGELDEKITSTLPMIYSMVYDDYRLSDKVSLTTGRVELLDIALGVDDRPLLSTTQLSVMTMHRQTDAIEKVVAVTVAQQVHLDQTVMYHDYQSLHTLTQARVNRPLHERYVIYQYVDGSYSASVEQYDLMSAAGGLVRRPMTLYDSGELLFALDDAAVRSLNDIQATPPRG